MKICLSITYRSAPPGGRSEKLEVSYDDGVFHFRQKVGRRYAGRLSVPDAELPPHAYDVQQYFVRRLGAGDLGELGAVYDIGNAAASGVGTIRRRLADCR